MTCELMRCGLARPAAVRALAATAVSLGLLLQTAGPVRAQPVCMPHDDLRGELHNQFAEAPTAGAIANNGALVQLFANRDRSSWTLVMTRPAGISCILVAGEEWNDLRKREEERIAQLDSLADLRGR